MTNSDNQFGLHNKMTKIITEHDHPWDGSTQENIMDQSWADVAAAKSYIFTDAALAVIDECATQLQWAIVNDSEGGSNNSLKFTIAFGTRADPSLKNWADKYKEDKETMMAAGTWFKEYKTVLTEEQAKLNDPVETEANPDTCPRRGWSIVDSDDHLF